MLDAEEVTGIVEGLVHVDETIAGRTERWRIVERCAWVIILAIAAVHLWLYRFEMVNLDGISYLELGEAWRDGRWADAISSYWSPLYAWVLGLSLAIARPGAYWEYPLVHLVNGVITIGALGGFAYLVRGILSGHASEARGPDFYRARMPAAVFVAAAYAVFAWVATELLVVWMESPDLLGSIFVFAAAGAVLRLGSTRWVARRADALVLGFSVGLGYLARAAMLPVGVLFLIAPIVIAGRRALRHVAVAATVAMLVVSPWIVAISAAHHRLTIGDAGRLNYVWFVNDSEDWPHHWPVHWPHFSGEPQNGTPIHAARRLSADPVVYEFAQPIAGTYPMWYDPSWWYDGVRAHFDVKDQLRRLWISAGDLYRLVTVNGYNLEFFNPQPALAAVLAMLVLALRAISGGGVFRSRVGYWLPPLGACAVYAAVYVEPRYLGAYIALMWLLALASVAPASGANESASAERVGETSPECAVLRSAGIAITAVLAATVIGSTWMEAWPALQRVRWGLPARVHASWIEAQRMAALGMEAGDRVGIAGSAQVATRWAHLAHVRIVAEVPQAEAPKVRGAAGEAARARMVAAFASAGATWAVIEDSSDDSFAGWQRVQGFPYLVKRIAGTTAP